MTALPETRPVWAIVPVKRLNTAKSRLGDLLDPAERVRLARAMLTDVLCSLTESGCFSGIAIVTGDANAAMLGASFGATIVSDPSDAGTNRAVELGLRWLKQSPDAAAVVVPGDVPFATPAEYRQVVSALRVNPVVLVPATRDGGTNMLGLSPSGLIAPAFGPQSFSAHLAAAAAAGVRPAILPLPGAGHDVDVAGDLFIGESARVATRTRGFLGSLSSLRKGAPGDLERMMQL